MTKLRRFLQFGEKRLTVICVHSKWQSLTPWSGDLLKKLTGSQLVKKFPALYVTPIFQYSFSDVDKVWGRSFVKIGVLKAMLYLRPHKFSPVFRTNVHASQRIPRIFLESKGPLSHSHHTATCPCPEPKPPCPLSHPTTLRIHRNFLLPNAPGSSKCSLSLRFPHQIPAHTSHLPHTYYMRRHSPSFLFDSIWWAVQIMKFLVTHSSPIPCCLVLPTATAATTIIISCIQFIYTSRVTETTDDGKPCTIKSGLLNTRLAEFCNVGVLIIY